MTPAKKPKQDADQQLSAPKQSPPRDTKRMPAKANPTSPSKSPEEQSAAAPAETAEEEAAPAVPNRKKKVPQTKAKAKAKAKAAAKKTTKQPAKQPKAKATAKAGTKAKTRASKGTTREKTFARRYRPDNAASAVQWEAIRDAFNDHVRDTVLSPSRLEESACVSAVDVVLGYLLVHAPLSFSCVQDPFWQMVKPKLGSDSTYEVYFAIALDCVDDFRKKHADYAN